MKLAQTVSPHRVIFSLSLKHSSIIEEIINDIECARAINYHAPKEGYEFRENWLKSIKDKVQLQPKQEWSEEDEAKLKSACALIRNTRLNGNEGIVNSTIEWLKLFKQRYTWKPSDGQMNGFKQAYDWYNTHCAQSLALNSLYNDLKKLKGE